MPSRVQEIYNEICSLSHSEKAQLYELIASDFETAGWFDDSEPEAVHLHVPRWLYRILARWK